MTAEEIRKNFWKDKRWGYHADMHLAAHETECGKRADPDEFEAALRALNPDWVQVDSKGHHGYASYFSKVPDASVPAALKRDTVRAWREATRRLGLPLICHYSNFLDTAAAEKHTGWGAVNQKGEPIINFGPFHLICARSDYFDRLSIPQLVELVTEWGADGVWIDGDGWAYLAEVNINEQISIGCNCPRCLEAYRKQTGRKAFPLNPQDPDWELYRSFQRESYLATERRVYQAVRAAAPTAQFCINQIGDVEFREQDGLDIDWYSGDFWGENVLDQLRYESAWFQSTEKPWDLMSWPFLFRWGPPPTPRQMKPLQQLYQEAAMTISSGGHWICCNGADGVRTSRQIPWHMPRLAKVGQFIVERESACHNTSEYPQAAVISARKQNLRGARNAIWMLRDVQYSVSMIDEMCSSDKLAAYRLIAVPEQELREETVVRLKTYAEQGGRLLITGASAADRFGRRWLGVGEMKTETVSPMAGQVFDYANDKSDMPLYFLPDGLDGAFPLESPEWGLLKPDADAEILEVLYRSYDPTEDLTPYAGVIAKRVGKGVVAFLPADFFAGYYRHLYLPEFPHLLRRLCSRIDPQRDVEVTAPTYVDVVLRKKDGDLVVNLINRSTGIGGAGSRLAIDEIQPVGPITITVRGGESPARVELCPENRALPFRQDGADITVVLDQLEIHSAIRFCRWEARFDETAEM